MGKYHATPLILVLNNSIYGIEEMLDQKKMHAYNKIPSWNYSKVPEAMGCTDWMTAKVRTSGGLGEALERASKERGRAGYVEVMLEGGAKLLEPLSAERLREEFRATF